MCLVSLAWQVHPDYPIVFAGNRDEYHSRPTAAADWWENSPDVFGGRDLAAGGSWLGVNRSGRLAVVTNRPDLPAPAAGSRSRGELVSDWLTAQDPRSGAIAELQQNSRLYGGFSLLLAEPEQLRWLAGGNGSTEFASQVQQPGIIGLSNTAVADPWPKLTWLNQQLAQSLGGGKLDPAELLALLQRTTPVASGAPEDISQLPFITGEAYGTRSSSVVTVDRSGECRFLEQRFGPGGSPQGTSEVRFQLAV